MTDAFNYSAKLDYLQGICRDARLTRSAIAVASVLVEYAHKRTGEAYPSIARIVEESGVPRTTCLRAIRQLEDCAHLSASRKQGAQSLYLLTHSTSGTSSTDGTSPTQDATSAIQDAGLSSTGSTHGTDPVLPMDPEQEEKLEAIGTEQVRVAEVSRFAEFWSAYPRKEGSRKKCGTTWNRAKLDRQADEILADLAKRGAVGGPWHGTEMRFIPHPLNYLNGERWKDEWTPAKSSPGILPRDEADDDLAAYNAEAALRIGGTHG